MAVRNKKFRFPLRKAAEAQNQQALETFLAENVTPTEWQRPTLQNSWVDYDTASYGPAKFRREGNVTHMQGLIKNGTTAAFTLLFTLPIGFRPDREIYLAVAKNGGVATIYVTPAGGVYASNGVSATWTSINGSFQIA